MYRKLKRSSHDGGQYCLEALERRRHLSIGQVDTTFGTNGSVTLGNEPNLGVVLVDGNEKLLVNTSNGIEELNTDGSVNTAFGTNGFAASAGFEAQDMIMASGGQFLVVGDVGNDLDVARYNQDGSLDSTFGSAGIVDIVPGTGLQYLADQIALQSTGQIIVSTALINPSISNPASDPTDYSKTYLFRLTTDGGLDTAFGTNGSVDVGDGYGPDSNSLIVLPDDTIFVGQLFVNQGEDNSGIAIIEAADGSSSTQIDSSTGLRTVGFGPPTIDSSGRLIYENEDQAPSLLKAYSNSSVTNELNLGEDVIYSITPEENGQLLVLESSDLHDDQLALVQYNSDFTTDNTFALGGFLFPNASNNQIDYGAGVSALLPNGDLIVPSTPNNGDTESLTAIETTDTAPYTGPAATAVTIAPPRAAAHYIYATVTLSPGNAAIDTTSLKGTVLYVNDPIDGSSPITANFVDVTGRHFTKYATYVFRAPNDEFSRADNGNYTFTIGANTVTDTSGNGNIGGVLGTEYLYLGRFNHGPTVVLAAAIPDNGILNLGIQPVDTPAILDNGSDQLFNETNDILK
jgi:uncharacterized delta-60 repeat protein